MTSLKKLANEIHEDAKNEADLVRYAHEKKLALDRAKAEYEEAKEAMVAHARLKRGEHKSLELVAGEDLRCRITFGTSTKYDPIALERIRDGIGADLFDSLFRKTVDYSPTRQLAIWMKRPGEEKAKHLVMSTADIKARAPDVRWVDAKSEEGEADDGA